MSTEPQNDETEKILNSYQIALDIFKLNNDNYFKRVQVFMYPLQVGVAVAFTKVIYPIPTSWKGFVAAMFVAVLGGVLAVIWKELGTRQSQYLEFNRRYLRNLEIGLKNTGLLLDYFNLESSIFRPPPHNSDVPTETIEYATACILKHPQTGRNYAKFKWIPPSKNIYPETYENTDNLHKIGKVKGGLVRFELNLTLGIAIFWFCLFLLCFVMAIVGSKVVLNWVFPSFMVFVIIECIVGYLSTYQKSSCTFLALLNNPLPPLLRGTQRTRRNNPLPPLLRGTQRTQR